MSLLDDAKTANLSPGPSCLLLKLKDEGNEHWDDLAAAIRDHSIKAATIARVATGDKYGIAGATAHTILRHRNNLCVSCRARGIIW